MAFVNRNKIEFNCKKNLLNDMFCVKKEVFLRKSKENYD
jgi:hypothetical protein